jgi:predicted phosphodiesterase
MVKENELGGEIIIMRMVVFSDTHGHCLALDAMLDDLRDESYDSMVCLGDTVQGGPQPVETVARLRELGCPIIMGNADDWLLTGQDSDTEPTPPERLRKLEAVREWQLSKLSADDLAFIRSFQPTFELPLEADWKLHCYHGSPKSFDDVILPLTPDDQIRAFLDPQPKTIYCGGHTHVQFVRQFAQGFHFNPGSVGLAFREDQPENMHSINPWAEYAILTVTQSRLNLEFRRAYYPASLAREIYLNSGRPFAEESAQQYHEYCHPTDLRVK